MRTIKPGFFQNDELAALPPLTRILFQGLWCLADREGRLEDRPVRIKAEVLPYDKADVNVMLKALEKAGFITRYSRSGVNVIIVNKFQIHQRPHVNEQESVLPAPDLQAIAKEVPEHNLGSDMDAHVQEQYREQGVGVGSSRHPGGAEASSPTRQFTDGWMSLFSAHRAGVRYAFEDAKDGSNVKKILRLASGDVAEALRRAEVHLSDDFWAERGASLSTFRSQWNRCVHGQSNGNKRDIFAGIKAFAAAGDKEHLL